MKQYRLYYQTPYLFDAGPMSGDGKELLWESKAVDFSVENDKAAQAFAKSFFDEKIIDLNDGGRVEHWHISITRLEEVARDVELPDLPMNAQQAR